MEMHDDTLYHYGVKGMKWGRRRYRTESGKLTPAGIKRYAKKGYSQDSYNENKTVIGKAYDKYTGAHKIGGDFKYAAASQKERQARAEKYLTDRAHAKSNARYNRAIKKYAKKGYSQDSYNENRHVAGKVYDKVTGAHKYGGDIKYDMASKKDRQARGEKYVRDQLIKKYAKKGFAQDAYKSNKTTAGKVYDKVTGAHKTAGDIMASDSNKKERAAAADRYLRERYGMSLKDMENKKLRKSRR